MTAIALLLFVGATGKSAQLPLVCLVAGRHGRSHAGQRVDSRGDHGDRGRVHGRAHERRVSARPLALTVVATVGALTALFAATMGLVQNDIKRVLAYSTVSQLGYMFLALGIGAFAAGIFHLMTHAFFKALLFLGSGSVIHAMSGEQDMRKMGALWGKIPITAKTFMVATIAIAGIPPLGRFLQQGRHSGSGLRDASCVVGDWLGHGGHDRVLHVPLGQYDLFRRVARIAGS